jgi:mono/diheme cytochrome c family protein
MGQEAGGTVGDLSQWEMEHGIGPVTEPLELGDIDTELSTRGQEIFELKCSACHKLEERYVAPALGDVTQRRTPEFVMNMMLNPMEMTQRHPVIRELLAEYFTPMTSQGLTWEDARALLEYLRHANAGETSGD